MTLSFKKILLIILLPLLIISCQKREESKEVSKDINKGMPHDSSGIPPQSGHPTDRAKIPVGSRTVIPDDVKGKWSAVKIIIEDKKSNSKKEHVVKLGSDLSIPDSDMIINVIDFLPDLKIEDDPNGSVYTSVSNDPNNPAVHVKVFEKEKEIFNGWVFSLFPTVHPFEHERYGIYLKEGIS